MNQRLELTHADYSCHRPRPHAEDVQSIGAGHRYVSADSFRAAMGRVATPVSVVTTFRAGKAYGSTVSAFLSLSLDPPMALVSLDAASSLLSSLEVGSPVGLNVLASNQGECAMRFAVKGPDKFKGVEWKLTAGAPRLPGLHVWMAGRVSEIGPAGDHVLVHVGVEVAEPGQGSPLTYWQGAFGTHAAF
ncbi:flavin reductase (DIM6/NTAB) family NADH-FMN oxidoreductase RutF [Paenarthrobacter nicotinovorans]|uniref:flavin reductase family protein n=1 Tax=Micrococcaceae TaxID=1268 RepID=UPI0008769DBE|nr:MULTISPECIES: flavin reductase family protein [Micrococcaceae]MDR6438719.1 flavin reductase (DIM6/NTAB) family NADH-FMN oxidoreductase RutF [Paenarthrobacter nicotinovorans]SCZ56482.1 NADH-FMN oxidoreductase RutF, flavin reductase (DIM6/NTAB) family [Arthrobacter sp. UNCCL28]